MFLSNGSFHIRVRRRTYLHFSLSLAQDSITTSHGETRRNFTLGPAADPLGFVGPDCPCDHSRCADDDDITNHGDPDGEERFWLSNMENPHARPDIPDCMRAEMMRVWAREGVLVVPRRPQAELLRQMLVKGWERPLLREEEALRLLPWRMMSGRWMGGWCLWMGARRR
jgi:hypothetical protein